MKQNQKGLENLNMQDQMTAGLAQMLIAQHGGMNPLRDPFEPARQRPSPYQFADNAADDDHKSPQVNERIHKSCEMFVTQTGPNEVCKSCGVLQATRFCLKCRNCKNSLCFSCHKMMV